ncbi:rho guanine nucleotide exchange factor 11-like isoform X2 [Pteropus medius]|uniref:rho guanine nucleotide exchange factor 11-like isoform X2 n=1 Tax=Pteropus vampyrus TaxID=132908 RepID=UPI00196BAB2C|nr:rho guanine nucleotide exchange factor 11-like isoform X2 [Pteropus giganteus]
MALALNAYLSHAGIRLREARPSSTAEKAPSAPDKDKWLPFFPKTKKSSNSKKDKDALEDRKRNPLLRYIGKPRSSSQSSESMGTAARWGHSPAGPLRDRRPRQPQPSSGAQHPSWLPSSRLEQRPLGRAGAVDSRCPQPPRGTLCRGPVRGDSRCSAERGLGPRGPQCHL